MFKKEHLLLLIASVCACLFGNTCTAATLEEQVGRVQAHLVKNEMTAESGSELARNDALVECKNIMSNAAQPPNNGLLIRYQHHGQSTYDGVSISFSLDEKQITVRQTFGVVMVAFQDQQTAEKDNDALATLILSITTSKMNGVVGRSFSFSSEVEGYKIFQMLTADGQKTDDWRDDIVVLVKGQTIFVVTSNREKDAQAAPNTTHDGNIIWFSVLENGRKSERDD